ncbi:MAG: CHASE2 domain-containing protein [Candidatus Kapabacteria bacterium]|nr:CHASE2 domain-containing protein [Candidatus Kapabacteria bacterium]
MARKNKYKKLFNVDAFFGTIFVFLTIFIFSLIFSADIFTPLKRVFEDFAITDVNTYFRDEDNIKPDTNIILIDNSKLEFDETLDLIAKLNVFNPKVIALEELHFDEISPESMTKLDSLISELKNKFVIGYRLFDLEKQDYLNIYDSIRYNFYNRHRDILGYIDLDFQKDKRFYTQREFFPIIKADSGIIHSLAYKISFLFGSKHLDKRYTDKTDKEVINFIGNFNKFFFYRGKELLYDEEPVNRFTNKIILIGNCPVFDSEKELDDLYFTPLNKNYAGRTFPDMFKVIIIANIINMFNQGSFYNIMPGLFIILIAFLITYFNFILFLKVTEYKKELYELVSIFAFLIQSTLIILLTYYFYFSFNFDLKLTLSLIAIAATVFIFEAYVDSIKPFFLYIYNQAKKIF